VLTCQIFGKWNEGDEVVDDVSLSSYDWYSKKLK
jgi:hypothetical protein